MQFFKQYIQEFFAQADEQLTSDAMELLKNNGIILDPETLFGDVSLEGMEQEDVSNIIDSLAKLEEEYLAENTSHIKKFKDF